MQTQQEWDTPRNGAERSTWRVSGQCHAYRATSSHLERSKVSVDWSRIGGDESKLRKHYGLTLDELANAERSPPRVHKPVDNGVALPVQPTEALDDLCDMRLRAVTVLDYPGTSAQQREPSLPSDSISSKKREPKKFSIRKVFSRSDIDPHMKPDRDSVLLPAADLDFMLDNASTKRGVLPASLRRISIENRRYTTTPPRSRAQSIKDNVVIGSGSPAPTLSNIIPVAETSFAVDLSSILNRVQPVETLINQDHSMGASKMESKFTSGGRSNSRTSNYWAGPANNKLESPHLITGPSAAVSARPSGTVATSDRISLLGHVAQSQSVDSKASEGTRTLRASNTAKHPLTNQEPFTAINTSLVSPNLDSTGPGDWTTATASRQAMETISFFARLAELETRMMSVERSFAKLQKRDDTRKSNRHTQQDGAPDAHLAPDARRSRQPRFSTGAQSDSTPHSSALSEQPFHTPNTWLDASSSVSSFEDSFTTSSPWHSSRSSEEGHKHSPITPATACFSDEHHHTEHDDTLLHPNKHLNPVGPVMVVQANSGRTSTAASEIETMRMELAALRHDATQPSSVFGKATTIVPAFTEPRLGDGDDEHTAAYKHLYEFDDNLLHDQGRAPKGAVWAPSFPNDDENAAPSPKVAWTRWGTPRSSMAADFGVSM